MKSIEFQSNFSLNMIAFHSARYNILRSLTEPNGYVFSDDSKRLMAYVFDALMRWNFNACQGMSAEKIRRLCLRLHDSLYEAFISKEDYRLVLNKAIEIYGPNINKYLTQLLGPPQLMMQDINTFAIQMMVHTRYMLHEIDNLINKNEPPFISIDVFDLLMFNKCNQFMGIRRLDLYKDLGLLSNGITIKIYIEDCAARDEDTKASLEFMCDLISEKYDVLLIK